MDNNSAIYKIPNKKDSNDESSMYALTMCTQEFEIVDDQLIERTQIGSYEDGFRLNQNRVVITKEAFIKCYNEWILNNNSTTNE